MNIKLPLQEEVEVQMAPMIDMVFLLLIFFMVASTVKELDKVDVDIPVADRSVVPESDADRRMLSITADGQIYAGQVKVNLQDLADLLEADLKADLQSGRQTKVYIRADEKVPYQDVKKVMRTCSEIGMNDVIFATFETEL